jgi:hypothetical protein
MSCDKCLKENNEECSNCVELEEIEKEVEMRKWYPVGRY